MKEIPLLLNFYLKINNNNFYTKIVIINNFYNSNLIYIKVLVRVGISFHYHIVTWHSVSCQDFQLICPGKQMC